MRRMLYLAQAEVLHIVRDRVLLAVKNAMEHATLRQENERLREIVGGGPRMIGASPAWSRAVEQASMAARSDARVLLIGESGTGKELLAAHIHNSSPFASGPFVKVNCAAIPTELIETELFGHEKGSFTGATAQRIGRFETANNGTIFLDEIAEMSPPLQAKLLRVAQDGRFQRLLGYHALGTTDASLPVVMFAVPIFMFARPRPPAPDSSSASCTRPRAFLAAATEPRASTSAGASFTAARSTVPT